MREAFTYMFKDPRYNDKAMTFFIICFIAFALKASPEVLKINTMGLAQGPQVTPVSNPILLVVLPLIGTLFDWVLSGYCLTSIQAITKQNQNYILPFMNIGSSFVKGFKFTVAIILCITAIGILGIPFNITKTCLFLLFFFILAQSLALVKRNTRAKTGKNVFTNLSIGAIIVL